MSALTNRREARERALAAFRDALDRIIPPDESIPLKGSKFVDFEDQVEEVAQAVLPTLLEERATLEDNAQVTGAGRCPHCGSDRVYLEKQANQAERFSRHGPVVIREQGARCRGCGGSFSPSGS
jgi:DNA-directed RNA polymerase subunit RPC12/RpoP